MTDNRKLSILCLALGAATVPLAIFVPSGSRTIGVLFGAGLIIQGVYCWRVS